MHQMEPPSIQPGAGSHTPSDEAVWKRRPGIVVRDLDNEALLYDPQSMSTHRLNETGLFIWNECDGATTVAAIVARLAGSYDVSRDEALDHVERLLHELARQKLVHRVNRSPESDAA